MSLPKEKKSPRVPQGLANLRGFQDFLPPNCITQGYVTHFSPWCLQYGRNKSVRFPDVFSVPWCRTEQIYMHAWYLFFRCGISFHMAGRRGSLEAGWRPSIKVSRHENTTFPPGLLCYSLVCLSLLLNIILLFVTVADSQAVFSSCADYQR